MLITIIEQEVMSAQSSVHALEKSGYLVEVFTCIDKAMKESNGDIYLIATVFSPMQMQKFMTSFQNKIILLLVNHKSNESLEIPLQLGAKDYFMKPINEEILIKKVKHYVAFDALKQKHDLYKNYHEYILKDINIEAYMSMISFPMIIITNNVGFIDQLVLAYANVRELTMVYIPLDSKNWKEKIKQCSDSDKLYLSGLETLGIKNQNILFEMLKDRKFLISSFVSVDRPYHTVEIVTKEMSVRADDILSISDYALMIIKSLQFKYPDVKIAEKLGYSRKKIASLRKRFNLFKEERAEV